jgi:hypothetical protein
MIFHGLSCLSQQSKELSALLLTLRVLPIDIDSIESIILDHVDTTCRKLLPRRFAGAHRI